VENMRDPQIWRKHGSEWRATDDVWRHEIGDLENRQRLQLSQDRTFSEANRQLYFNPRNPPRKTGDPAMDSAPKRFKIL